MKRQVGSNQLGMETLLLLALAWILATMLLALPGAIVITLGLIRLFRRRVGLTLRATAGAPTEPPSLERPRGSATGELEIMPVDPSPDRAKIGRQMPLIVDARQQGRYVAAVYAAGVGAYTLLVGVILLVNVGGERTVLATMQVYTLFTIQFATPLALAPTIILKKQPRFLALAVLAQVLAMWAWGTALGVSTLDVWLLVASVPTGAVLLMNVRRLRAIGPVVYAAAVILLYGVVSGIASATFFAWDAIGPIRFVRPDLADLPLPVAAERYSVWLWSLGLDQALEEIARFLADPFSVLQPAHPEGLTVTVGLQFFGICLGAAATGGLLAWSFVRWLARRHEARRASDQMLSVDVLMIIFVTPTALLWSVTSEWRLATGVLAAFIVYKLTTAACLQLRRRRVTAVTPRTLLLLRVFGFHRRTQRLLEDLGRRWRYLGPIRLVGGTDVAETTIEPHEFFEFLNGRLTRAFINNRDDLESLLSARAPASDPDGLFRVEDVYCQEHSWRMVVARLAPEADAVVMDLRGFSSRNAGCTFEIEQLVASVPLARVVLLVDRSTDVRWLDATLRNAWDIQSSDSPNAAPGRHRLRILHATESHTRSLDALLGLLCESAIAAPGRASTA